jgi:hypothetical protein
MSRAESKLTDRAGKCGQAAEEAGHARRCARSAATTRIPSPAQPRSRSVMHPRGRLHPLTGLLSFVRGGSHVSFADIEGSTSLLRRLGEGPYAQVLTDRHSLIWSGLAAHGGKEVNTQRGWVLRRVLLTDGLGGGGSGDAAGPGDTYMARWGARSGARSMFETGLRMSRRNGERSGIAYVSLGLCVSPRIWATGAGRMRCTASRKPSSTEQGNRDKSPKPAIAGIASTKCVRVSAMSSSNGHTPTA